MSAFYRGVPHHVYRRSFDNGIVFYSVRDHLVFFTFFTTLARKYDICVMGLSIMPDHLHSLQKAESARKFKLFNDSSTRLFAREYNSSAGRSGRLFESPAGFAAKKTPKAVRTCIAYVSNNQVEKRMAPNAQSARWNFLAYYKSSHPFSEPLRRDRASAPLRRALSTVKYYRSKDLPIGYKIMDRLFKKLNNKEKLQLTDFIVSTYNCLDYKAMISYYGSFDTLITAINSNTGSEYDIQEVFDTASDAEYATLSAYVAKLLALENIKVVASLDADSKLELAKKMLLIPGVRAKHVAKFLHMKIAPEGVFGGALRPGG